MQHVGKQLNTRTFDSLQEASIAAAQAASVSFGKPVPGIVYSQSGRRFISSSLPVSLVINLARRDSAPRRGDPSAHRNRPLQPKHVKEIAEYIRTEEEYLLPPLMLNAVSEMQVFEVNSPLPTKVCFFVMPPDEYLFVTDGQHRLEALKEAIAEKESLESDAIGVTIVEEPDLEKVHQDFYDAAQGMQLAKSLLVEFDGRAPLNWLTRDLIQSARVLRGRVEKVGTVGKNSLMLFTSNQVKQAAIQALVGDWSLYHSALQKQAEERLAPARFIWRDRIVSFLDEFATANNQWGLVADRPLDSGQSVDVPSMREEFLHFSGGGFLVLAGAANGVFEMEFSQDGSFTQEQRDVIGNLANLDWSRRGQLWAGYLVGADGKVHPHKTNIALAVAKVKQVLGLSVTEKESARLERAEEQAQHELAAFTL